MAAHAAAPEQQGQLDTSPSIFAVLAAINAAGYDTDADSPNSSPLRALIRKQLASRQIHCLGELKTFYVEHRLSDPTANLSQYISFALAVGGPPDFSLRGRAADIPPDVARLDGLAPLMTRFYEESGLEEIWKQSQPEFDRVIERYHDPVSEAVLDVNGFLRHETSGATYTRFQIYIDLLGAPNQIQTRSYGPYYYVVVSPSPELRVRDIRHAYLHYLLDPYATRHQELVMHAVGLADHAQRAPALDDSFKTDFLLLETESLIKAVEARLDKKPAEVDQAMREGYILTAFFNEQLGVYLHQQQAMRFYYSTMIQAINLKKEDVRLSEIEFIPKPAGRVVPVAEAPRPPELAGVRKTLAQADQLYKDRDLEGARQLFLKALEENGDKPLHAEAYYGLGRIAALERNPELAERMFEKTLEMNPDPPVKAWSLVYLARLEDAAGDRQQAVARYKAALAVEGASQAAHDAAEQGIQRSFEKKTN